MDDPAPPGELRGARGAARRAVLIAPDKFTGSLSAQQAGQALALGVRDARPGAEIRQRPVADGGDGTLAALAAGGWELRRVEVPGPTGSMVSAQIGLRGDTAAIELADCCGRLRLPHGTLAPMSATTRGFGVALARALEHGATEALLCVGGSASTDGGLGFLAALGVLVLDRDGREIAGPAGLAHADRLDLAQLRPGLRGIRLTVATDVSAPLLGPSGAAQLFAPQKGASPGRVAELERAMASWARVLARHAGHDVAEIPGAGAAGGVVAGILAVLGPIADVRLASGAEVVLDAIGLDDALAGAGAVITGEGCLDEQTLLGKAPSAVAARAAARGVPVLAVAGRVELDAGQLNAAGITAALALTDLAGPGEDPLRDAAALARRGAARGLALLRS